MSDEVIKRALEVASLAACDGAFHRPCSHPSLCADAGLCLSSAKREEYAAAIAAFLDAPDIWEAMQLDHEAVMKSIKRAAGGGGIGGEG